MRKEFNLKNILNVLRKQAKYIIIITVAATVAAILIAVLLIKPQYTSSIEVMVNNKASDGTGITTSDIVSSQELTSTYIVFMRNDEVLKQVAEDLGGKYSLGQIRGMLSYSQINDAMFIRITAVAPDPADSRDICTSVAQNAKRVILNTTEVDNLKIVGTANMPNSPSSPNVPLFAVTGFIAGLVISFIIFYAVAASDNTIKDKGSLELRYGFPIFGDVPSFDQNSNSSKHYGYSYKYGYGYGGK